MDKADPNSNVPTLYLQQIDVEVTTKAHFRVKLLLDDENIDVQRRGQSSTWISSQRLEIPPTCLLTITIKSGHKVAGVSFGRMEEKVDIRGQDIVEVSWASNGSEIPLSKKATFDDHPAIITASFRPSATFEMTRTALHNLEASMKDFKSVMSDSTQQRLEVIGKYAVALSELNSFAGIAVSVVTATFELLKEQRKYDDMISGLADRIKRILPFVKQVQEETLYDDAELLDGVIKKMYELVLDTAEFISNYVYRSPLKRITKFMISMDDQKRISDFVEDLDKLVVDFDRAVSVEVLRTVKETGSVEDLLFLQSRLNPVVAGYSLDRGCMPKTRASILDSIIEWALQPQTTEAPNIFWLYGMPGLGKTAVANTLCSRLHDQKRLGGGFFCRRDDPRLSEPKYTLPTIICDLAGMWPPYRKLVVEALKNDPQMRIDTTAHTLFSQVVKQLQKIPPNPFVVLIDALDECGDVRTRRPILKALFEAASQLNWIKIIVTSRPEQDIEAFFHDLDNPKLYLSRDLAMDDHAQADVAFFAQTQFASVAVDSHLPDDWPGKKILSKVVARANGLFIYVETIWRLIKDESDPEQPLIDAINETSGEALGDLYKLYSTAIESRIGKNKDAFRRLIGVVVVSASYRPLCDESVATLAGLEARVVRTWVDKLSSILYRDDKEKNGIRARHISIIEFLTSSSCSPEIRVNVEQANIEVGLACLATMIHELRFNICGLNDSLLSNKDIKDLESRVKAKLSDALQYSCLHWADHLCSVSHPPKSNINQSLDTFFTGVIPLYWIEALSLMGKVAVGVRALRKLILWTKDASVRHIQYIKDLLRFLLIFNTPITTSTPHLYISALPFTPTGSDLWENVKLSFGNLLKVQQGRTESWPTRPEIWLGHTDQATCVSYSPDGQNIVSCSYDKTIRLWDAETGRGVGEPWKGHIDAILCVTYSPDGARVLSSSRDRTIRLWNAETGGIAGEPWLGHTSAVCSIAYSPDGRYVVSGSEDKTIRLWDADTGEPIGEPWKGHTSSVRSVTFAPDGLHVVSGSGDETIQIWDVKTGRAVGAPWKGHEDVVCSVAYSSDGRNVVSGSYDGTVRLWNVKTGAIVGEPWTGHEGLIWKVAFSPDGRRVISCSGDYTIQMWDAKTGDKVGSPWLGHENSFRFAAYSPDGMYVVSCSTDGTLRLWVAETGEAAGEPTRGQTDAVDCVAYSPDGRHIISSSLDKTIRLWDAETGMAIGEPWKGHTERVWGVIYSIDGRYVASGSRDGTVRIWDATTGTELGEPLEGHDGTVYCIAYSPDTQHIASGTDNNTIQIWDTMTRKTVGQPLKGHTNFARSVAYSPDGRYIVSGSENGTIRLWDWKTGDVVGEAWEGHTRAVVSIAYSPDGRNVVSSSNDREDQIRVWDVEAGKALGGPWNEHTNWVQSVAYSPDGRYIVSGSFDGTIRIWDMELGKAVGEALKGHVDYIYSVAYSPDGQHVVSGSYDGTIRKWDVTSTRVDQHTAILPQSESSTDSSTPLTINLVPDSSGWVRHPNGGLLLWVPEDFQNGLTSPAILTIPTNGRYRVVRLDFTDFRYGASWETAKETKE